MTDNPESAVTAEDTSPPSDDASQETGQQTSGSPDVDAIVSAVLEHPDFQKSTQSVKDKRIAGIQTDLEEQGSEIARLAQALGHTPEEVQKAQTQIAMEDMVKAYQSGTLPPPGQVPSQQPTGNGIDLATARDTILTKVGLPANTPGIDEAIAAIDASDPIAFAADFTTWAQAAKANTPTPTAADTPPVSSGKAVSGYDAMDKEELGAELLKLQANPTKNAKKRAELLEALQRKADT